MIGRAITIEVVYALPGSQTLLKLNVAAGTTVGQALAMSGILAIHPGIDLALQRVGIFGRLVEHGHLLASGDRIEIYRPLIADPKAGRHARVAKKRAVRDSNRDMRA
jgi:putative ubiquitin-RnfH superfamily antitoxin RatB of RatAB toxin-antitoxin module